MQRFRQIYSEASDDLRNTATEEQIVTMLSAIDRKLGAVKDSQDNGCKVDFRTSGTVVTLSLKTTFERGTGIETFVYRVAGKEASLLGYHINSNDLLIN